MEDVMLTFYAAAVEADAIAVAVRARSARPVHVHAETVHGRDFADARIAEQVSGTLQRCAVSVVTARADAEGIVAYVETLRRAQPVRWIMIPVIAAGRLA
jgi:hypothetical protein